MLHVEPRAAEFSQYKDANMRKLITTTLAVAILAGLTFGMVGCTEESSVTKETDVKAPGGTTKITEKTSVDKSGQNPPAIPGEPKP